MNTECKDQIGGNFKTAYLSLFSMYRYETPLFVKSRCSLQGVNLGPPGQEIKCEDSQILSVPTFYFLIRLDISGLGWPRTDKQHLLLTIPISGVAYLYNVH